MILTVGGLCGAPWAFSNIYYGQFGWLYIGVLVAGVGALGFTGVYMLGYRARQKHVVAEGVRAVAHLEKDPAAWLSLPPAPDGHGHLYVIQFSSGTVKVGQTNRPAQRLNDHRRYGWAFGVVIVRAWISPPHAGYISNETRLIDYAARVATGDRARREFFHGADFDRLVACATNLAARAAPATGHR